MMVPEQRNKYKKVTIIGDTSKFHLGSKLNYSEFRKLIEEKYNILQDIPYDAFGVNFIDYLTFFNKLKESRWWKGIEDSDILIVHGEGLTEKCYNYVYPYLYFSKVGRDLGIESWLVNFSMYEGKPFLSLLKQFSYMACRDILTQKHLLNLGLNLELSFDCCILGLNLQDYSDHNNTIAVIRGRHTIDKEVLKKSKNPIKYNCCWIWEDKDSITLPSIQDYLQRIKKSKFTLSTSFHGNIISYLSGIPFISLDKSNPKYQSLDIELLPKERENILKILKNNDAREKIHNHYQGLMEVLRKRSRLNCI